eukprot:tig00000796_g4227.t1
MGDGGRGSSKGSYEDETPPQCRKAACAIQECLAAKNHQQEACREVIERFNECRTHSGATTRVLCAVRFATVDF